MKTSRLVFGAFAVTAMLTFYQCNIDTSNAGQNMAVVAVGSISQGDRAEGRPITTLNDGINTTETGPVRMRSGQTPVPLQNQWVQYEWTQAVKTSEIEVFWWDWEGTLPLPQAYRISYWNGSRFVPVTNPKGLGFSIAEYNKTTFDEVETSKLRIDVEGVQRLTSCLLEWKVIQSPNSKNLPPIVKTNGDRTVMMGAKTYLTADVKSVSPPNKLSWKKVSGPGNVTFTDGESLEASATFSVLGEYVLAFSVKKGSYTVNSELVVKVTEPPKEDRLEVVYTKNYSIDNQLWNDRAKAMIVNWIPWCIDQCENHNITTGGLDNFIEAAKAIKGLPHDPHKGLIFANAWVHQTVESMCIALMIDPKGDKEIIAAQAKMKRALEKWIPIILAGQEPDGYMQTAYTLADRSRWANRWSASNRSDHEGYVAGYFIESAINHYTLTDGKDLRLYNAAKKLADCWANNIGPNPGQIVWYDGHQGMEMALVRFGRFVNDMEGGRKGDRYIALAKFLLDSRNHNGGTSYDQSHTPVQQQYEAVGHAVRAVYQYSAMADIAVETQDPYYQSATMSIWDNMINKKYYVTGGVGSGDTSEGFGDNYSLSHNAYCEACSSCALMFFQYKLNMAYHDAKYADLYEETMYNALLGSLDLPSKNFYYPNPLSAVGDRYPWHTCPCCVGNIPRTLLMIPTWTYLTSDKGIYVNLFIGSTINVEKVFGTDVEMVQKTNYPWDGNVAITVNPKVEKEFTLFVRVPDRTTSELYTPTPAVKGLLSLSVNGQRMEPVINKGYAEIKRTWKTGDKVEFELPMEVQKVTADPNIKATTGQVTLRYGALIYNFEEVDNGNDINESSLGLGPFKAEWDPNLLEGVMVIKGTWADGKPMLAIPNYARMNRNTPKDPSVRTPRSNVWVKQQSD